MTQDKGASAKASVRSSAAAQPASRYSVAAVYQLAEPGKIQTYLRHATLIAESKDEALGAAIVLFAKADSAAGPLPHGAGLVMHSTMLADRNDSEDRTEAEGEAR